MSSGWKCEFASSGCNYPEGECSGACEAKKQAEPVQSAGAQEPVGEVRQQISQSNTFVQWYKQPKVGDKLYTAPPAAAINEQLLEALCKMTALYDAMGCPRGSCRILADGAIASAEAEKARGRG